tara:strand:- start:18 stop:734 length:717 start_codon:yes stop_codon:yes gene_type:complete
MAVNIDTVYQRVLAMSNKEQRGYITPLEFNLLANQAQLDIFNQYFYDLGQLSRLPTYENEYSDSVELLEEKMEIFKVFKNTVVSGDISTTNTIAKESNVYKLGEVYYTVSGIDYEVEEVTKKELTNIHLSPLTHPSAKRPVFIDKTSTSIQVFPSTLTMTNLSYNYIKKPADVSWGYIIVGGETLNNTNTSINFELHESEETVLVIKILTLAGVVIKDPNLYQISSQEEIKNVQQEKA